MDKTSKMAVLSLAILLASTGCTNVNNSKQEDKDCNMTEMIQQKRPAVHL